MSKIKEILYSSAIALLFGVPLLIAATIAWGIVWTAGLFILFQSLPIVFSVLPVIIVEALGLGFCSSMMILEFLYNTAGSFSNIPSYLLSQCLKNELAELSNFRKFAIYLLLKLGADINGFSRWYPAFSNNLCRAIINKDIEKIQFLIKKGADICHVPAGAPFLESPLCCAINSGDIEIVKSLNVSTEILENLSRPDQIVLLTCALNNKSYDVAKLLVEKGISFDASEKDEFFDDLLPKLDAHDFQFHYKLSSEADQFFTSHETFEQTVFNGHILLHTQEDSFLSYTVKNHFGAIVSGQTTLQKPALSCSNQEKIEFEKKLKREIIMKVYQDDFDTLMQPYVQKVKDTISELYMPAYYREDAAVPMPKALCDLIGDYVGSDVQIPRP